MIERIDTLSEQPGHMVWRVVTADRPYVLKWVPGPAGRAETETYRHLQGLDLPTAQFCGSTAEALLLEDLASSDGWPVAEAHDLSRPQVARAIARWYGTFHDAGERLLAANDYPRLSGA